MPKVKERINEMARTMCDCYHDGKCSAHHNAGCALIGSVDCISKQKALSLFRAGYIHISDSKNIVKQAQIDVLNKLRSRISDRDSLIQSYIADGCLTIEDMYTEIDELIAGVENENQTRTNQRDKTNN